MNDQVDQDASEHTASPAEPETLNGRYRRYRSTVLLTFGFVVILAMSWYVYPSRPDIGSPDVIIMKMGSTLGATSSLLSSSGQFLGPGVKLNTISPNLAGYGLYAQNGVEVTYRDPAPGVFTVTVTWKSLRTPCAPVSTSDASCPVGSPTRQSAALEIEFPATMGPPHATDCTLVGTPTRNQSGGANALRYVAVTEGKIPRSPLGNPSLVIDRWRFRFSGSSRLLENNGLNVVSSIPEVQIWNPGAMQSAASVSLNDDFAGYNSFVWNQGPSPVGYVWKESLDAASQPTTIGGVDNQSATHDSLATFVSGALLGIGGGALVGALQEFLDVESRRDDSRRARRRKWATRAS